MDFDQLSFISLPFYLFNISWTLLWWALLITLLFISFLVFYFICLRFYFSYKKKQQQKNISTVQESYPTTVGFFHPYCNAGGGGERVLWAAIKSVHKRYPDAYCVVYTGDVDATGEEILEKAKQRFNICLTKKIHFVYLVNRSLLEATNYPFFTLLLQNIFSIRVAFGALKSFVPDIYIDTMGYAFASTVFKYFGNCKIGCYIHYPTISTDMLNKVVERNIAFNNMRFIARSALLSNVKVIYYKMFALLYGIIGRIHQVIMVNSSWTKQHILDIWQVHNKISVVYPPCDIEEFLAIPLIPDNLKKFIDIISVSQFRPEKDHRLQILVIEKLLKRLPHKQKEKVRLVLVGGCRDDKDKERMIELKNLAENLGIGDHVVFKVNISFEELKKCLSEATIGIHTMWNEHFGIGVVECMAAGVVMLAHDSGGPKMDIVVPFEGEATGFLASDVGTFSECLEYILSLDENERQIVRRNARRSVSRFSEEKFELAFLNAIAPLFCT